MPSSRHTTVVRLGQCVQMRDTRLHNLGDIGGFWNETGRKWLRNYLQIRIDEVRNEFNTKTLQVICGL